MVSAYDHHCSTPLGESHFWPKSQGKNRNWAFYPSAKSPTDLKTISSGVIFRGRSATNAQKFVAPPKRLVFDLTPEIFTKNRQKFCFRCRKMKRRESSETRFPKVSRQSELCSRGKRPFKVCRQWRRSDFHCLQVVGSGFASCRQYCLR